MGQKSGKDPGQLIALVQDADQVLTQFAPVDATVIGAMGKCRVIVRYGIGVDNVDLGVAAARGIPVCNVPDYCIDEVADHTLGLILDLTRRIAANAGKVRSGGWGLAVPLDALCALKDLTVGLVGFGRIGSQVARRLVPFRCRILVCDPAVPPSTIHNAGFLPVSLEELLHSSDLVTLHCPSTEHTRNLINGETISRMKVGALLVNTSRGTLVNTDDLIAALKSGRLSAAALDVTDPEPLPPGHPLLALDNVVLTPHMASASPGAVTTLRQQAAGIVALAVQGKPLPNIVNGVRA
jgi:D-3-phosphoglycerate dehydrogenase